MRLRANPVVDSRRRRRAGFWVAGALLMVTAVAGCQTLSAWSVLMLGNSDYADSSDYPDPCASSSPSLPPHYAKGEATVRMTGGTVKTLKLILDEGQFMPTGPGVDNGCFGGTEAAYKDETGAWMLNIDLPNNGAPTPSAPEVGVFLVHQQGASATGIDSFSCQATLTSVDAAMLSGTATCTGVAWMDMSSAGQPSPSGSTFDMAITFTATP